MTDRASLSVLRHKRLFLLSSVPNWLVYRRIRKGRWAARNSTVSSCCLLGSLRPLPHQNFPAPTPSSSSMPLPVFFPFFLLSFFFFSLPADSEFWLAPALFRDMVIPDHHFTVPRERSQRRLFFPPFTKQAALNYSVFLDLPLACPSGIFIRESQSQHCRPS